MPNYSFDIRWSERDGEYVAVCPSFPSLSAFGNTPEEALTEARVALELYIEEYQEEGIELPPVIEADSYSGQLRLRLPRSLHAALAQQAQREGVSLNSLLVAYLSAQFGRKQTEHLV